MVEWQICKNAKFSGITEAAEPYTQLNEQDLRNMEEITSILKQLLEKIINCSSI
jgi:hypothetical protein